MVDAAFDSDEIVKQVVSEMSAPLVRRNEQLRGEGSVDYAKLGMSRKKVTL